MGVAGPEKRGRGSVTAGFTRAGGTLVAVRPRRSALACSWPVKRLADFVAFFDFFFFNLSTEYELVIRDL